MNGLTGTNRLQRKYRELISSHIVFRFLLGYFALFLMLPNTHQEALERKFRVEIRIMHRCLSIATTDLFAVIKERRLKAYVIVYLKKRLRKIHKSDLGKSPIYKQCILLGCICIHKFKYWTKKENKKSYMLVTSFQLQRMKKMIANHESYLISWIKFIEEHLS